MFVTELTEVPLCYQMPHPLIELGKFTALDPATGCTATFAAEEQWATYRGSKTNMYIVLRDQRSSSGREIMLPEAVVELWQTGQIPVERVPALAEAIALYTNEIDCQLMLHIPVWNTVRAFLLVYLGVTVPLLVMAYFGWEMPGRGRSRGTVVTWPWAIGVPTLLVGIVGVVAVVQIVSNRSRRRDQMNWLLAYSGAGSSAAVKLSSSSATFVKNMLIIYAVVAVVIGVLGYAFRGQLGF